MRAKLVKSVIAASLDAIVCADVEGKIILWNRAAETMFGYMEQEALGQPLTILLREEDRAAHLAGFQYFLKTGRPHRLIGKVSETLGLRKDGTVFSKEMSLAAEKVEGKWVFTAIMRDITQRKQVKAALFHRKAQLQSLLDASLIINANLDLTGIRKALIATACKMMNADSGAAGMVEDGRMVFREYRRGDQWDALDYTFEPGFGVPGHILQTKKPYISNDAEHDVHVIPEIRQALDFHQLIDVPVLNREGQLLGCFEVHDPEDAHPFDDADIKLLEGLAASAAVALDNANLISKRRQAEERLRILTEAGVGKTGVAYYRDMVRATAKVLQMKCVFIAELKEDAPHEAHALAVWIDDDFAKNFSWRLLGTPCEKISEGKPIYFQEHVQQAYPDDVWLAETGAESYFAIPFLISGDRVIGHIGILDDKPMPDKKTIKSALGIFAERAGAELNRMCTEMALRRRVEDAEEARKSMLFMLEDLNASGKSIERAKQEWEATFDAVTDPVFLHDRDGNIMRANNTYAGLAGMDMHDIIGKPYWQVFPVLDGPMQSCLHALETKEEEKKEEEEVPVADGRIFVSHSYAVRNEEGGYAYSVHFMQDITERKQAAGRLRQSLEGTIKAIASAVEARDPYTAGHQARVSELACVIAKEMELDAEQVEGIRWGSMIHDIGKIHLPAEVLSKPSRLTEIEHALIKEHPQIGYDILKSFEFPWPVADIAHQHHERLDGSGYPQGLEDGDICLEARIVAVADVVEAMSSHRPYRPGLGIDKALAEIGRGRGKQYDANAVDACLSLFSNKEFTFE